MPNATLQRNHLSNQIFEHLRDAILNREYLPGQRLPAERALCQELQVTRGPMREALKRLEQARLIQIRQGDGSRVLDFEETGGLELLPALAMPGGRPNFAAVRSMFECRALVAPEMARLAALRIQAPRLQQLLEVVEDIEGTRSPQQIQSLDVRFHGVLARASENLAYLLIYNSARDLFLRFKDVFTMMFEYDERTGSLYRRIYEAVQQGQPRRAHALCTELIDFGGQRALEQLERLFTLFQERSP